AARAFGASPEDSKLGARLRAYPTEVAFWDARGPHEIDGVGTDRVGYGLLMGGRFGEALPWFERAIEIKQKGDVHGRVDQQRLGMSMHHVGFCYWCTGRYAEALPWFVRDVEATQKGDVHGRVNHESLGRSLLQVGFCHTDTYAEALPWFERAVEAHQK